MGALQGNQSGLLTAVPATFQPQETSFPINKGHGRIEKRTVSISQDLTGIPDFPGLKTLIRVESERHVYRADIIEVSTETGASRFCKYPQISVKWVKSKETLKKSREKEP